MPPRLILNADDFGLTPGINRAIVELHQAGVLTSATLMATGPAFADAVAIAHANPTLGVGCHLVFVDGMPLSHPESIPSLLGADGKTFRPSLLDFAQAALRNTIRPADLARETAGADPEACSAPASTSPTSTPTSTPTSSPPSPAPSSHIAQRCGIDAIRNPFEPQWSADHRPTLPSAPRSSSRLLRRFEPGFNQAVALAASHGFIPAGTLGIAATGTLDHRTLRRHARELCTEPRRHHVRALLPPRLPRSRARPPATPACAPPASRSSAPCWPSSRK